MKGNNRIVRICSGLIVLNFGMLPPCHSLEPEPRKWGHLPVGTHFAGVGHGYTEADIFVDPAFRLEDVRMEMQTWAGKYIHSFKLFDKSARIDLAQAYTDGTWSGSINGVQQSVSRSGMADTVARFAITLYGAPPLSGKDYVTYRAKTDDETIVGVGLAIRLPTGEYFEDKLINIGDNRYTLRPQIGVGHNRGKWTAELTGEVALFSDNDDYFKGKRLEQAPLYLMHAHLSYTVRPGFWIGGGLSYDYGGEKTVDGVDKNDTGQNTAWALNAAFPINRHSGINAKYISTRTRGETGFDSDTLSLGVSMLW